MRQPPCTESDASDAVAGAVVVDLTSQRPALIESSAPYGGAARKRVVPSAMWPFNTQGRVLSSGADRADRDGARDVGGAVEILPAGIHQ